MKDQSRTNQELLEEISSLKQKIKQLEQSQSELRRAKESLQESEARVREIVDNAPRDLMKEMALQNKQERI